MGCGFILGLLSLLLHCQQAYTLDGSQVSPGSRGDRVPARSLSAGRSSGAISSLLGWFGLADEEIDCSDVELYQGIAQPKGSRIVAPDGHLYEAQWSVSNTAPPSKDTPGWKDLGECTITNVGKLINLCKSAPQYVSGRVFQHPTLVSYQGTLYRNSWATSAVPGHTAAWSPIYSCPGDRGATALGTESNAMDCTNLDFYVGQRCVGGTTVYTADGIVYYAKWEGGAPAPENSAYKIVGRCSNDITGQIDEACATTAEFSAENPYEAGEKAIYQGKLYGAKWWTDADPEMDTIGSWTEILDCSDRPSNGPTNAPAPASTTRKRTTSATTTARRTTRATQRSTTTPKKPTTTTKVTTKSPTTKSTTTRSTTKRSTTISTTTKPRTTTKRSVTTTTSRRTTTTAADPDNHVKPDGPVGPNGECVWPEWDSQSAYKDGYVTFKNKVYQPSYYADPGLSPLQGTPWVFLQTCTGDAPRPLTEEEILAAADPNEEGVQLILDPWNPTFPTEEECREIEAQARVGKVMEMVAEAALFLDPAEVDLIEPGRAENPENVKRVERIFPEDKWYQWFPIAAEPYTYTNFIRAVGLTPLFCKTYDDGRDSDQLCMKSLATSFAHFVQETSANWPSFSWPNDSQPDHYHPEAAAFYQEGTNLARQYQALWYVRESGHTESEGNTGQYRKCGMVGDDLFWSLNYPCYETAGYFGRGAKQLSWNYNYGRFSDAIFNDVKKLLKDPSVVADTWLNFASATWFFVTPQSPKPSMQQVIDGSWVPNDADIAANLTRSFGTTIQIINGGLECGKGGNAAAENRGKAYKAWMEEFGLEVDPSEDLDCQHSQNFGANSAGAYSQYWVRDWSGGKQCKAGDQQTPWIVSKDGDYEKCVNFFFRSHHVLDGAIVADYGDAHTN